MNDASEWADPAIVIRASATDHDIFAVRCQNRAAFGQGMIRNVIQDDIVMLAALGKVLLCVIDNAICAQ